LTGLTEFVVADGLLLSVLNVTHQNGMNSTNNTFTIGICLNHCPVLKVM